MCCVKSEHILYKSLLSDRTEQPKPKSINLTVELLVKREDLV